MLIKRGASAAGIVAAEQIVRKVVLVIELAIAAGCLTFCSLSTAIKKIEELTVEFAEGLVAGVEALETAGEIASGLVASLADAIVVRPLLTATASLDVLNWKLDALPSPLAKQDMLALGLYWSALLKDKEGDDLLTALSKPVSANVSAAGLVLSIVREINDKRKEEGLGPLPVTKDKITSAKPFQVVALLVDQGYLKFVVDHPVLSTRCTATPRRRNRTKI